MLRMVGRAEADQIGRQAVKLIFERRQRELPVRPGGDARPGAVQKENRLGLAFAASFTVRGEVASLKLEIGDGHLSAASSSEVWGLSFGF